MLIDQLVVGPLGVNCFILGCERSRQGVVIDPGAEASKILDRISKQGLSIRFVINSHGHFDHVGANRQLLENTGAQLLIHGYDIPYLSRVSATAAMYGVIAEDSPLPAETLTDGMIVTFGECQLEVRHTPGHTPGGCCFYVPDKDGMLFAGDTLFAESVGRTDLPGGSHQNLVASIKSKLLTLPDSTTVFPGHGETSTIGHERLYNPYLAVSAR